MLHILAQEVRDRQRIAAAGHALGTCSCHPNIQVRRSIMRLRCVPIDGHVRHACACMHPICNSVTRAVTLRHGSHDEYVYVTMFVCWQVTTPGHVNFWQCITAHCEPVPVEGRAGLRGWHQL